MTLYKKTLLILAATLICLLLVLYLASRSILLSGFSDLERLESGENAERAMNVVEHDLDSLSDLARDWADRGDSYAFLAGGDAGRLQSAYGNGETRLDNELNALIILDRTGNVAYQGAYDLGTERFTQVPGDLLSQITGDRTIVHHPDRDCVTFGIIDLPEGPMMVASAPIVDAAGGGEVAGSLVAGRFLNRAQLNRVSGITLSSVSLTSIDGPLTPDMERALEGIGNGESPYVEALGEDSIGAYSLIDDIHGEPALIMRVDTPRDINAQGEASVLYLVLSIFAVGLVFGGVIIALLYRLVISRVEDLGARVRGATASGDLSLRLATKGRDELAILASDINDMMSSLESSKKALAGANARLEGRVREKTESLRHKVAVLQALSDIEKEIIAANDSDTI